MKTRMFRRIDIRFLVNLFAGASAKRRLATCIVAAVAALAGSSRAGGLSGVVDVQLNHTSGVYSGQGAVTTADAHIWNLREPFHGSGPFVDSTGAITSVTATVNRDSSLTPGAWTGNSLLDGSASCWFTSSPQSFT